MQKTDELELLKFHKKLFGQILAVEYELRRRVQALAPDAYATACGEHDAPMLGTLIRLVETEKLQEKIIPDFALDFRAYHPRNSMRARSAKPLHSYKYRRISVALWLFCSLRNGVCHGSDILALKMQDGKAKTRIFAQIKIAKNDELLKLNASVLPENIERFLADFAALVKPKFWEEFA